MLERARITNAARLQEQIIPGADSQAQHLIWRKTEDNLWDAGNYLLDKYIPIKTPCY